MVSPFAYFIAPAVTAASIIFSSSKIPNRDILVPANQGPPGKMAVRMERCLICGLEWNRELLMMPLTSGADTSVAIFELDEYILNIHCDKNSQNVVNCNKFS